MKYDAIGKTRGETIHGNPGESRRLPAGIIVGLLRASNLPPDSPIKWWAHPLPVGVIPDPVEWPANTVAWARDVGVGLHAGDVEVWADTPASLGFKPRYYRCGICDGHHPEEFDGDCRQDRDRFPVDRLDELHGPLGWEEIDMPTG